MIRDEKETNNLIDVRDRQKELREKQAENEEFLKEIEKLNTICFALSGNIKFEREKNESLEKEIQFRKKHLENIKKNYKSFEDKNNPESKVYVVEMKNKLIKKRLEELLTEKIPELNISNNKNDNSQKEEENEFHNLVIDHVNLIYIQYDSNNEKTDRQSFRISNTSDFKSLKRIACQFWDLDNENDYVITDEAEALLYNEEMAVDSWLKDYSVLANTFKLISINSLKIRTKLMGNQENRMKENNKFSLKGGVKKENVIEMNMAHDSSNHKIKEFFNEYLGLKPFTLITDEKTNEASEKKIDDAQTQAKNIETSFWMLLILVLFFGLNLYFLYGSRDVGRNNIKIDYIKNIFDNSQVSNFHGLYNYLITKIGFNFMATGTWTDDNYPPNKDTNNWINNTINSFTQEGVDFQDWFKNEIDETNNFKQNPIVQPLYDHLTQLRKSNYFILASSIHLISNKVNTVSCSTNAIITTNILSKTEVCYEIYHTSATSKTDFTFDSFDPIMMSEKQIMPFLESISKYKTAVEAGISLGIESLSGSYDGSGYHTDIPAAKTDILDFMALFSKILPIHREFNKPTNSSSISAGNNIDSYFLVDRSARCFTILFTLYFPFEDLWMSCAISFDLLPTGVLNPNLLDFKMFVPNIYSSSGLIITDIIRLMIIFIFMFFMVLEYFEKVYDKDSFFELFLSSKTFLNLFIFILYLISFCLKLLFCYNDESTYFSADKSFYKDSYSVSNYYNQIYYYESLLFAAVSIKILTFLKLNDHVKLFYNSIEMGVTIFIKYCFFLIVILLGYACIAHILWGPYVDEFRTFGNSFLQILLFTMGFFNSNLLLTYNSAWTVVFIGSFFLFVLYFMYAIFISIYAESLRRTVIKLGYPEDHQLTQWTLKDYIVWLCYCIGGNKKKEEQIS